MFAGLLAEIRAYGEGLIIAEQIPARLVPDVIKNTAIKIVHRLPAADDREAVGATMNATPSQSRYLVTLPPGRAAVFTDGMDFPILATVKDGTEREVAAPSLTGDARTVVHPRSVTCGAECRARPCTLRDMRAAQRALDSVGWVRLWAELAVLAHLTGWPIPAPKPATLAVFTALPARVRQCALSHAVDTAAARGRRRWSDGATAAIADPAALAAHTLAAMTAWAERGEWFCQPDEPGWRLAGSVTEDAAFGVARPSVIEAPGRCRRCWRRSSTASGRCATSSGAAWGAASSWLQDRWAHVGGRLVRSAAPAAGNAHPDQRCGGEQADGRRDPVAHEELRVLEPVGRPVRAPPPCR